MSFGTSVSEYPPTDHLNFASSPERCRTAPDVTTCCWRCSRFRRQTGGSEIRCINALPVVFIMSKNLPLILWHTLLQYRLRSVSPPADANLNRAVCEDAGDVP